MTIQYALREGFVNLVFGERDDSGERQVFISSLEHENVKVELIEGNTPILRSVSGCAGEVEFNEDLIKEYGISYENFLLLFEAAESGDFVPVSLKDLE